MLSSPRSLHTRILAQLALGFHNMTVRSEEEFSPKHRGIQPDTEATVIAPHPEFDSRGWWGHQKCLKKKKRDDGRHESHVCLALPPSVPELFRLRRVFLSWWEPGFNLRCQSQDEKLRPHGFCQHQRHHCLPAPEITVFSGDFYCVCFHISSRTLHFLNLSLACGGSG